LNQSTYQGRQLKKINFSKSGFSIMEVMIAAGLLGIVTVGVMQITKNMTKSSKSDALRVEFNALTSQMQSILRDEYSCEATLSGLSPSGLGSAVNELKRRRSDGSESVVFQIGQSYGAQTNPIFLKSMAIKNYNVGSGFANFEVKMNKGRKDYDLMTQVEKDTVLATSYGTAIVVKTLKLQVILDASGNIKDCLSDKDDYTAGTCGMIDGDWSDKVKCKSINISANAVEPAITSEGYMAVKNGLTVGSALTTNPGDGSVNIADKAIIANDTTITAGKLIFNNNDARINPVAGSNLYFENKTGSAGANIIAGKSGAARTTVTSTSIAINKNGTVGAGLALDVTGNTTITGSGSTSVTLKVGNSNIQYNGTDLVLNKPAGGLVRYNDASTDTEVASKGFVNSQLGQALTGNPTTLSTILSNLGTLVSGSPVQAIAATTCGFYTNMTWNGTRCVDNRNTDCPAGQMMIGFNNGLPQCITYTKTSQTCSGGQLFMGYDANGNKVCSNANNEIGTWVDAKIDAAVRAERARVTCTGGQAAGLCIVNGTSCPAGTSRVGNWGTTSANTICGGSTTGCGGCGNTCNTGSHGFSNRATESCCAAKKAACGPATSGSTCGSATLTQVGCTMP